MANADAKIPRNNVVTKLRGWFLWMRK